MIPNNQRQSLAISMICAFFGYVFMFYFYPAIANLGIVMLFGMSVWYFVVGVWYEFFETLGL